MMLVERSKITKGRLGGRPFLYNPTNFDDLTSVAYNDVKTCGMSYPALAYGGGETREVTFTIYLNDAVEDKVTRAFISHLRGYLPTEGRKGYQFKAPPKIIFAFGWYVKECYLSSMGVKYLAFSPSLQPIEAEVEVTLKLIQ